MDSIPEELQRRWAEKDSLEGTPTIAVINLLEEDSAPPDLDFLDESLDDPAETEDMRFHGVKSGERGTSWIDPLQLHGTLSIGPTTVSIATYVPKRFPKTGPHS